MNKKAIIIVLITLLTLTVFSPWFLPHINAINVKITSISPETHKGNVGETVSVIGTINTTNGFYQIWFGNKLMINETATENDINASFPVPPLPRGNYTIILRDIAAKINATSWFYIETAYYLEITEPTPPEQLQENTSVEISVSVTGGESNVIYVANITVDAPTPSNETYLALVPLSNTTDTGIGNATITYPDAFGGAHTNYTGTYTVSLNETLVTNTFFIGLTDRTEYHRSDTVNIRAAGYRQHENVTVTILFGTEIFNQTEVTSDKSGVIHANWTVPSDAKIGIYTLNITSTFGNTTKNPPDIQNFTVPGFDVNVTTTNLAGEPVPNVIVNAFENVTLAANETSNVEGIAFLKLEIGYYTLEAYYKNQKVGLLLIEITNATALSFPCNLTNLRLSLIHI